MPHRPFQAALKYRRLDPKRNEIRLLEVYPAESIDEPIRSRLIHVRISSEFEYIGLSLLYGSAAEREVIYVDDQPLPVPTSIELALRNVRTAYTPDIAGFSRDEINEHYVAPMYPDRSPTPSTAMSGSSITQADAPTSCCRITSGDNGSTITAFPTRASSITPSSGSRYSGERPGWKKAAQWLRNAFRGGRNKRHSGAQQQSESQPLRIWLDALCMNPEDVEEMSCHRSHLALAYREAKFVVGWVGGKEEGAETVVAFLTTLADAAPPELGDAKHRKEHPEQYGPIMEFLKPFNEPWKESLSQGLHVTEIPLYIAVKKFFQRPYFCNNWILSELAFATIPVFLVGDLFMNWLQMLRYVFITEELLEKGSIYYPEENRHLLNHFPLGSLYFFLEEYDRRRQAQLGMERREIKGQTVHENGDTQVEPVIEDSRSRRRQSNY